jgi:nitrate/nitrite transporter NarK
MVRAFARWFPSRERGTANGVLFLGSRLGGALAPALTVLVITQWGWRATFVVFGSIGVLWAVAWYVWFRDNPDDHRAMTAEELAVIREEDVSASSRQALARGPAAAVAVPWRAVFASRTVLAICAMYFAFGYGLYFYFTWLPTYLTRVLGFSALAGGVLAGLPFVLAGAADVAGGRLTDRLSAARGLRVGRCGVGASAFATCAALLLVSTQAEGRVAKALLLALALASADLGLSACWAVCLDVGRERAGAITGLMNTFGNLGGAIGPLVMGVVVERWNSWTIPFYITAAVYALGAACWLAIDPTRRLGAASVLPGR